MGITGVLLMAYGGPNSLDDIEPYLLDVRGGRRTPPELVAEIRERYAAIGGKSPLLEITRDQAAALESHLNRAAGADGAPTAEGPALKFRTYVGMRHWYPYIREAVAQIAADGIDRVVALVMAPQYSRMSAGAYFERLEEARKSLETPPEVVAVRDWHDHPLFIQAVAERAEAALERFPAAARDGVVFVFTAHSLPAAIMEQGDPYDAQVWETARLVAFRLGLATDEADTSRYRVCYQSAGARNLKWLGPSLEDTIGELAESGRRNVLVVPIGFVADHVEVLYDIDIEAKEEAAERGVRLERAESLNTSPTFIAALADLVRGAVGH